MERNIVVDIMKGFSMMCVIIGHCEVSQITRMILLSFTMPLFFMISGYYFKPTSIINRFNKDCSHLLFPYLLTLVFLLLYFFITQGVMRNNFSFIKEVSLGIIYPTGQVCDNKYVISFPVWFLCALFLCRSICNVINTKIQNWYWLIIVSLSIFVLSVYSTKLVFFPFAIQAGLCGVVFYNIGYLYRNIKFPNISIRNILFVLLIICWLLLIRYSHISMMESKYGFFPIDILGAIGGTVVILILSYCIKNLYISKLISFVGRYSLLILCIHTIEFKTPIMSLCNISNPYVCGIIRILLYVIISYVAIRNSSVKKMFCS